MKKSFFIQSGLLAALVMLNACMNTQENTPCTYLHQIQIETACYDGKGVQVSAVEYGNSPDGFEWTIIALKDTTANGWTPQDVKIDILAPSTFTVPDSLANSYQRLIIKAATICQGQLKHSIYHTFVKTTSATTNCTVWEPQTN